jgi:hypothetical protein
MERFNFRWKLIENYFNALMVIVFATLLILAFTTSEMIYVLLMVIGAVAGPFIATFIDKKSTEARK